MTAELLFILFAFLLAGWIQGVIGFGFAIATTLLLMTNIDFTLLVFLNLSMSVITSLIAMLSAKNLAAIDKRTLGILIGSATMGLVIGIAIVNLVDAMTLKKITLAVIFLASIVSLNKNKKIFAHANMGWIGGFFSGILTPSTGINGPLVALHLNAAFTNKQTIRTTMLAYLFLIMLFGVVSMVLKTNLPANTWATMRTVLLPSITGYVIGLYSFKRLPDSVFRTTITLFLVTSSLLSFIYLIV
jgi:uncharacterized protein